PLPYTTLFRSSTDLIGDITETLPVHYLGVGRKACHDHARLVLQSQTLYLIVIHQTSFRVQAILHRVVHLAGEADLGTVSQVTTMGQAHAQHGVARGTQGGVYR